MKYASKPLLEAALEIQDLFEENNWQFTFIGGLALLRWGRRRMTEDVDGTLLTMFTNEEKYVDLNFCKVAFDTINYGASRYYFGSPQFSYRTL